MIAPTHDAARVAAPIPARAGIGLRFPHHRLVLAERPATAWFEVHPENYLGFGVIAEDLEAIRLDYPVSLHATGLSLGSAGGLDPQHLADLAELCRRIEPGLVSDHLSWSAAGGVHLPDLLPLPYDDETLAVVARNVDQAQTAFGRTILIENPSTYLAYSGGSLAEAQFLAELVAVAGCGVLLDVNNVAVSAGNLGQAPAARLQALLDHIPASAVGEIHLAGHAVRPLDDGTLLRIDDHASPVSAEVWALFETALDQLGPRPSLIEWDTDIPAFAVLSAEAAAAQTLLDRVAREPVHAVG
jgi:uncharacterized protein (UPF0276 family)